MRWSPALVALPAAAIAAIAAIAMAAAGCDGDTDLSAGSFEDGGDAGDASAADAGPSITVHTFAPSTTSLPGAKASATWAAYRLDDGDFHVVAPASEGTYTFPRSVARWTLALVCASGDDALTTVFVHRRTNATLETDVTLDESCTPPPPPAEYAFTGTLSNIPTSTQWFDFGYARTSRGEAIPVSGATGTYEIVGIEPGTWDLAFGVRDEPFRALTRFVIRRGEVVKSDRIIDVDLAGAGSFAPSQKLLRLHSLLAGDTVAPVIFYGAGGPFGIDVGPQDVPDREPDVTLAYSTVPPPFQVASDRYRGELKAEQDRRTGARVITFDVHEAIDLDMTFLAEPPAPTVSVAGVTPYVRLDTRAPLLPNAEHHEVTAVAARNRRTQLTWRSTYDARVVGTDAELHDVTPDLSALPGWKAAWGLPADVTMSVTVTGYETPQAVGDGTMQRSASKIAEVTP